MSGAGVKGTHHVAIAVRDLEGALRVWSALFGLEPGGVEEVASQKVRVAYLPTGGGGAVEFVQPMAEDSPIQGFLEKRGPGLHHICLEVEDAEAAWARLQEAAVPLLGAGPVPGSHGSKVFFLHPRALGGILVECKEVRKEATGRRPPGL